MTKMLIRGKFTHIICAVMVYFVVKVDVFSSEEKADLIQYELWSFRRMGYLKLWSVILDYDRFAHWQHICQNLGPGVGLNWDSLH